MNKTALSLINSIGVVPGAIGAWRRSVLTEVGRYEHDTLVEDADLTLSIIEKGYRIFYEPKAQCYTEAPETWKTFFKQRNRWQLGTLQAIVKHRSSLFNLKNILFGFVVFPMTVFNFIFIFIYPSYVLLLYMFLANTINHKTFTYSEFIILFITIFILKLIISLILEKNILSKWRPVLVFPLYIMFYLNIMAIINILAIIRAVFGLGSSWGHLPRTGNIYIAEK